jgi:hypothetical protein
MMRLQVGVPSHRPPPSAAGLRSEGRTADRGTQDLLQDGLNEAA